MFKTKCAVSCSRVNVFTYLLCCGPVQVVLLHSHTFKDFCNIQMIKIHDQHVPVRTKDKDDQVREP